MPIPPNMLTAGEVAARLRLSPSAVYGEIHSGRLRCYCFGKRCYRVSEEDLQDYLDRHAMVNEGIGKSPKSSSALQHRRGRLRHLRVSPRPSSQNPPNASGPNECNVQ